MEKKKKTRRTTAAAARRAGWTPEAMVEKLKVSSTYGKMTPGSAASRTLRTIDFVSAYPSVTSTYARTCYERVSVRKASPTAGRPAPDLHLEARDEFPEFADERTLFETAAVLRGEHRRDGRKIVQALLASLPGGTLDAVLLELLEHRASTLRVRRSAT